MCCEDFIEKLEDKFGAEKLQKIFCWVIAFETLAFTGLTLAMMFIEDEMDTSSDGEMMRFGPSFIFANLVFLYFAISAIVTQNKFSLIAYMFVMGVLSVYVIFQFVYLIEEGNTSNKVLVGIYVVRFIFIILIQPVNITFFTIAYNSCGWRVFKQLGADAILLDMYDKYQIFTTLISALSFLNILVLLIVGTNFYLRPNLTQYRYFIYIDIAIILVDVFSSIIGYFAISREKVGLLALYYLLSLPITPAIIYRALFTAYEIDNFFQLEFLVPILILGTIAFIGRIMLYIVSIFCCKNFGNQLLGRVENAIEFNNN